MTHRQGTDGAMAHRQGSDGAMPHRQATDDAMTHKQGTDGAMAHWQGSDGAMTHRQGTDGALGSQQGHWQGRDLPLPGAQSAVLIHIYTRMLQRSELLQCYGFGKSEALAVKINVRPYQGIYFHTKGYN